jgi:hypothetical protein
LVNFLVLPEKENLIGKIAPQQFCAICYSDDSNTSQVISYSGIRQFDFNLRDGWRFNQRGF